MKKIFLFFFFLTALHLFAAPYNGQIKQFRQPDGTSVDVKLYGTEYYMWAEGMDDYTLIRDKKTNWICYATLSGDSKELISTGIIYKGQKDNFSTWKNDLKFPKHIDISDKARSLLILKNQKKLGGNLNSESVKTDPYPVSGNIKGLCIVVDFSDEVGTLPMSEFTSFCNDLNYSNFGNNGSLRKYYSDISGGVVDYENVVFGYFRAPKTFAAYDQMPFSEGAQEILGLALNWIASQGFDFSTLSTNPDGSITAINLMYTGNPPNWSQGMWFHQGYYTGFSANGVYSGAYNCSPANNPLTLATIAHENGHMIGKWPDTYKYNTTTGPDGIGSFDLMCWYGNENNPVPPNPHFRSNAGWGRVVDVTYTNGLIADTANSLTCYKYVNLNDSNEFFLFENRTQTGRSTSIEDTGLTIWHIDRMGDNQTTHHEVYLVHANDDITDHSNACFHAGFNTEYSLSTTPNSLLFNGNPSGLKVWAIGAAGNIMSYKLGAGQAAPTFVLSYMGITGDNNNNGFLESNESGNITINASNFGQLNSRNSTVTCTAIGINAGLVNVINANVNAGIINVSQTVSALFNIAIASTAHLGDEVELKFEISDGTYSTYITKKIIVGEQVIMGNQQITTCSAIFYDKGSSFSNYSNNEDYTTTFLAATASQPVKAEFQMFDVEVESSCGYDYLNIFNGPNSASSLIGSYCGTNVPPIIISSHPSGALTFVFHSDGAVTGLGWQALISCAGSGTGLNDNFQKAELKISPNPSFEGSSIMFSASVKNAQLIITDVCGRTVASYKDFSQPEITLKRKDFTSGVYYVKLLDSGILLETKKMLIL